MLWNDIKSVLLGKERQTEQASPLQKQLILYASRELTVFSVELCDGEILESGKKIPTDPTSPPETSGLFFFPQKWISRGLTDVAGVSGNSLCTRDR